MRCDWVGVKLSQWMSLNVIGWSKFTGRPVILFVRCDSFDVVGSYHIFNCLQDHKNPIHIGIQFPP